MIPIPYPRLCFTLYTAFIAVVSLLPAEQLSAATVNDKIAHFLCYALFALLAGVLTLSPRRFLFFCIGIASFGLLLEGGQSLVPGRDSSLLDALANTAGTALGFAVVILYFQGKPRNLI